MTNSTDRPVPELIAEMVETLRRNHCLRSPNVAAAFGAVGRHLFVPGRPLAEVYSSDTVVPTHFDADGCSVSSSSAPNIMAIMLEQLRVRPGMRVLEIGAGTGYNAGLLSHLVGGDGQVVTVDLDSQITTEARQHLHAADIDGVHVVHGDGWLGSGTVETFDRVIATVGAWEVSPHWFGQLDLAGVLVMPLWVRPGLQVSVAFVRDEVGLRSESLTLCGFMRLRGPHAGPDSHVAVPGWADRVDDVTAERNWIAAIEHATPFRVTQLRSLISGTVETRPAPRPAPGWITRLALEEPDVIVLSGRDTLGHVAAGLFTPDRHSLALFDAGKIVAFGNPSCAERLVRRLGELAPLRLHDVEIRAVAHPARAEPGAQILERPDFDLVVRVS
ncbi:MAG: methyltransferase domain-containing protein [Acidimicrobiia bacterium]